MLCPGDGVSVVPKLEVMEKEFWSIIPALGSASPAALLGGAWWDPIIWAQRAAAPRQGLTEARGNLLSNLRLLLMLGEGSLGTHLRKIPSWIKDDFWHGFLRIWRSYKGFPWTFQWMGDMKASIVTCLIGDYLFNTYSSITMRSFTQFWNKLNK